MDWIAIVSAVIAGVTLGWLIINGGSDDDFGGTA
jgi:hypothetical protein